MGFDLDRGIHGDDDNTVGTNDSDRGWAENSGSY